MDRPDTPELTNRRDGLWFHAQQLFQKKMEVRSDKTERAYKFAIENLARHLGREPLLSDLDDDVIVIWTKAQSAVTKSPFTIRERLGRVLALWNWLAKRRTVDRFPTVPRPPAPDPMPIALSENQLRAVFDSAMWEPGKIDGIRAGWWWQAFLGFVWNTAERRQATLSLRWEWLNLDRKLCCVPADVRKGRRKPAFYPLWQELVPLLWRIKKPERDLVFPWPYSEGKYFHNFGRIMDRAGLPNDAKHKTHCLRCSHATWLKALGGDATAALMHSTPSTTERHYIDQRLLPVEERRLFVPWQPDLDEEIATEQFI